MRLVLSVLIVLLCAAVASAQMQSGMVMAGTTPPQTCAAGYLFINVNTVTLSICGADNTWTPMATTTQTVPSGSILLITSGTCPTGYTEASGLDGVMFRGTVAAHNDVGTTGGNDTITPTVASLTAAAQTFTGSSATTSAVSAGTPAGSNGTVSFTPSGSVSAPTFTGTPFSSVINHTHTVTTTWNVQGGTTAATTGTHVMTSTATGGSARVPTTGDVISATTANPSGGVASITPAGTNSAPTFTGQSGTVPAQTFTGSALATHTHTLTATGTNGTSAVTGTLNSFDNRPAFIRVIGCIKN